MSDIDHSTSKKIWTTLGWSAYLACSWTWCIGMFLPVLLVRDYGVWGWVIFAIPNVIGAAAMGWVFRDRATSRQIVRRHRTACEWFSIVTIAFQLFFAIWIVRRIAGFQGAMYTVLGFVLIRALAQRRFGNQLWIAAIVFAISVLAFVRLGMAEELSVPPAGRFSGASGLPFLAPLCLFGFALCPYLDLTFHRACAHTDRFARRIAFGLGFGVMFLSMILFTLLYARQLIPAADGIVGGINVWLVVHLVIQLAFTAAIHFKEAGSSRWTGLAAQAMTYSLLIWLIVDRGWPTFRYHGLDGGELVYRLFMSFYGLVFPAYVWLCMIPSWRTHSAPTRENRIVFWIAILIAAPMYWMGFIEQKMFWLAPGLAVVLLARLALSSQAKAPRPSPGINAGA